ncbi:MAG: hypothetical protein V1791_09795, partial [Pseudomonadota bacterium]
HRDQRRAERRVRACASEQAMRKKPSTEDLKGAMHNIFNGSINEVLSRTIVTSLTTFLAAAALFLFGGEVIHDFSLALLIGIGVATYSSVFVASPIVVLLENRALAKQVEKA